MRAGRGQGWRWSYRGGAGGEHEIAGSGLLKVRHSLGGKRASAAGTRHRRCLPPPRAASSPQALRGGSRRCPRPGRCPAEAVPGWHPGPCGHTWHPSGRCPPAAGGTAAGGSAAPPCPCPAGSAQPAGPGCSPVPGTGTPEHLPRPLPGSLPPSGSGKGRCQSASHTSEGSKPPPRRLKLCPRAGSLWHGGFPHWECHGASWAPPAAALLGPGQLLAAALPRAKPRQLAPASPRWGDRPGYPWRALAVPQADVPG